MIDWYRIVILGLFVESHLFAGILLVFFGFNFLSYCFRVILGNT